MDGKPLIPTTKLKENLLHTDEVETWAVNDVNLTVNRGEYLSICGRRVAVNPLCCRSWDYSIPAAKATTYWMATTWLT